MAGSEEIAGAVEHLRALLGSRETEIERLRRELRATLDASAGVLEAATEWRGCCDTIGDPIAVMHGGCEVLRANQAFAHLAGVAVHELPGLRCSEHLFGRLPCPGAHLTGAGAAECEAVVAGTTWLLRSFPITKGGLVIVFKNVTRERDAINRSIRAQKLGAVGQLAGGVVHEINNPLAGILALAQVMRNEERSAGDLEKLDLMVNAALRSKRVLDSVLCLAQHLRAEDRRQVDLAHVLEDALFVLRPRMSVGVELIQDLRSAVCLGDARLLSQLAGNLLMNALDAMGDVGRLTVCTEVIRPGTVALTVADSGTGVPLEYASRIFEPFFTTKPRASGLGLSICCRVVEEHGGVIHVDTPPEGGAKFVVELPAPMTADRDRS